MYWSHALSPTHLPAYWSHALTNPPPSPQCTGGSVTPRPSPTHLPAYCSQALSNPPPSVLLPGPHHPTSQRTAPRPSAIPLPVPSVPEVVLVPGPQQLPSHHRTRLYHVKKSAALSSVHVETLGVSVALLLYLKTQQLPLIGFPLNSLESTLLFLLAVTTSLPEQAVSFSENVLGPLQAHTQALSKSTGLSPSIKSFLFTF